MSTKYNEEAEDLMFELFDEDDFTKVISFVDKYGCDFVDRDGRNLLMNFIVEGKSTFAIELIKQYKMNGLNLDLQDDSGWTALHFAAQENSPEIIELLAGSKANLNIQEENGRTPLFIAIFDRNDKSAITYTIYLKNMLVRYLIYLRIDKWLLTSLRNMAVVSINTRKTLSLPCHIC